MRHACLEGALRAAVIAALAAAPLCASAALGGETWVDERSYSTTTVREPPECSLDQFRTLCSHMERLWSTRFERSIVSALNSKAADAGGLTEQGFSARMEPARQEIRMRIVSLEELGFAIVGADILQKGAAVEKRFYETENIDLATGRVLGFSSLFKDPEFASMICARKFDEKYRKFNMPNFEVLSAALETGPWNFMLRPDGIEIVFTPGTAEPGNRISSLFVSAEDLKPAGIAEKYFPVLDPKMKARLPPARERTAAQDASELESGVDQSPMGQLPPPPPGTDPQGGAGAYDAAQAAAPQGPGGGEAPKGGAQR
ncbi:MAG: hypothetical protein ACI4NA_07625 [Succinivibrio sp.]